MTGEKRTEFERQPSETCERGFQQAKQVSARTEKP
ncbi:hypothetical protein KOR42_13910 [Thalassoglobus neptunius]|uniref:Uncharacterized protein n=1 Tax=Thalassoglobus neptunius TaxID=1938619 RepID=A0A5C5X7U3_9PLAN|nr:hypothetical protein KOR42_13910 [Thalassoglobus neptunius]